MELRHPILFIVLLICFILFIVFYKGKKKGYKNGSKIANTEYIKNNDLFKKVFRKYKILKILFIGLFSVVVISCILILARPSKVEVKSNTEYNRDIFLCMDVSSSVNELNQKVVESLIKTVKGLNGERFGISIFNTSSVTLVPLTNDYDYVLDVLGVIDKSLEMNNNYLEYSKDNTDNYYYLIDYISAGTLENSSTRGSSLIGDGLASCVFNFENVDEDRTRIIIFSTDNELAGTPIVKLDKAAEIAKSRNILVFGIGPDFVGGKDEEEYKSAVLSTGGKYYKLNNKTADNVISDIEKTSKSALEGQIETTQTDLPEIPFIIILCSLVMLIIVDRKVVR